MKPPLSSLAEIRQLAKSGDLTAAFKMLSQAEVPERLEAHRDTIVHNFFANEQSWKTGTVSVEDYNVQQARSARALFDLIDQIGEGPAVRRRRGKWMWAAAGLLILLFLGSLWAYNLKTDKEEPAVKAVTHGNQSPVVTGDNATLNFQNTTVQDSSSHQE
ncbi:MAG: hypothetical protein ACE362_20060 [Phaeodactylibacter xiamenensis]|uniref:Effector-associated domain-containing protein n=1 Tax=Phaeodactylibacter xiamenensis TaxID=1524460 RepID=A0A098S1F6_9BACT|nr:hypothetical protein [Phaeodactylibacter xiamenensis]KGE85891.1 hypothetical protein IX84_25115 [Phaeodactylibacter xiamenensis]MCR9051243.1 hypothetical protein [bacterium]